MKIFAILSSHSFLKISSLGMLTLLLGCGNENPASHIPSPTSPGSAVPESIPLTVSTPTPSSSSGASVSQPTPTPPPSSGTTSTPTPTPNSGSNASPTPTPTSGSNASPTPTPTSGSSTTPTPSPSPGSTLYDHSCKEILAHHPQSRSGTYSIYLGSSNTVTQVECDMNTRGGGWTVLIDGANSDRASLSRFFDNTDESIVPDQNFIRDPMRGIFWTSNQYFIAKNMPANSEFQVTFNLNWLDPQFGTNCYAILGMLSPFGYTPGVPNSFTAFIQRNDTSEFIKATYNNQSVDDFRSVKVDAVSSFPYPFVDGSRVFAGSPYWYGNTCRTFFFKRFMVR